MLSSRLTIAYAPFSTRLLAAAPPIVPKPPVMAKASTAIQDEQKLRNDLSRFAGLTLSFKNHDCSQRSLLGGVRGL